MSSMKSYPWHSFLWALDTWLDCTGRAWWWNRRTGARHRRPVRRWRCACWFRTLPAADRRSGAPLGPPDWLRSPTTRTLLPNYDRRSGCLTVPTIFRCTLYIHNVGRQTNRISLFIFSSFHLMHCTIWDSRPTISFHWIRFIALIASFYSKMRYLQLLINSFDQ